MKRLLMGIFSLLPAVLAAQATGGLGGESPQEGSEADESYEGKVVVIDAARRSLSDARKVLHWEKILNRAEEEKARAVVFKVNAEAGNLERTLELVEQVLELEVPTYSFIEGQAHRAGALLAVSAKTIYVTPESMIGGGGFVDEAAGEASARREASVLQARLRAIAGKQGHDREVLEALMVPVGENKSFGPVSVSKGSVLTLTGEEAVASHGATTVLAKGVANSLEEMLEREGLAEAPRVTSSGERAAADGRVAPEERQGLTEDEPEPGKSLPGRMKEESVAGKIVVLKIGESDLVNKQSFKYWRRMLRKAEREEAAAVIFELDTPGGYAFKTKEMMTEITRLKIPTFAFVNTDALSAGALVSVATDAIYMNPDSLIGAAGLVSGTGQPIEETMRDKLHSVFTKHVQTVAEKKGYDAELIKAMMVADEEKDRVFGDVVVPKGELLTLTAREATSLRNGEPLLAKGIVTSVEEIAEREGLGDVPIVRPVPTPFEQFAWWAAKWSFILILIGIGAAYAEMKAPGFGIGGAISLAAFAIFFFGNYAAGNLAGYEMVALFLLGVILVLVEIFLIPGTGVAGIIGVLCIAASLLFGMVDEIDWRDWRVGDFSGNILDLLRWPALSLGAGLIGGSILVVILMRFLPNVPLFRFLIVEKQLAGGASLSERSAPREAKVGWTGVCLTDLRPAGKVRFADADLDVVADGGFIPRGAKVRVAEEDGMRVIVTQIEGVQSGNMAKS